jgi:hypothetical protein
VPSLSDSTSSLDSSSSSQERTSSFEDVIYENENGGKQRIPIEDIAAPSTSAQAAAVGDASKPIDAKGKGKTVDNVDENGDEPDSERGEAGVKLVKEGDEIDEASSSILAFLNAFPRIVLRAASRKFVFVKGGLLSSRIKATCTHADLANDHKAGQEVFFEPFHSFCIQLILIILIVRCECTTALQARVVRGCR